MDKNQSLDEKPLEPVGEMNRAGEVKGAGPAWACGVFAEHGHDYQRCHDCYSRFELHLEAREAS